MFVVFLKFAQNRAQASRWMTDHGRWLTEGFASGAFLMAGGLDESRGGLLIALETDRAALLERLNRDPFVAHGVVEVEVHGFKPSLYAPGLASALAPASGGQVPA